MSKRIKAKIMYFERVLGKKREFVRLSIYPTDAIHAIEALRIAGFTDCGREHWMRKRKACQK